jgi:hypothetical protein
MAEPALPAILLFSKLGKNKAIFHTAAPFQNVRVIWRAVALANHICGTKLEFWWQGSFACPVNIILIITRS